MSAGEGAILPRFLRSLSPLSSPLHADTCHAGYLMTVVPQAWLKFTENFGKTIISNLIPTAFSQAWGRGGKRGPFPTPPPSPQARGKALGARLYNKDKVPLVQSAMQRPK